MTIRTILERVNEQFPHNYNETSLLAWINDLERDIAEVFTHYEDTEDYTFTDHTDIDEEVQIDRPDVYVPWIISQICLANEEYDRYNNHAAIFQAKYQDFKEHYLRTHLPINEGRFKL